MNSADLKSGVYQYTNNDKIVLAIIALLSVCVLGFLVWLVYFKGAIEVSTGNQWINSLPALNAFLNTLSSAFLITAFTFIKQNKIIWHKRFMSLAALTSGLFLVSYITYHHFHGDSKFLGTGLVRPVYFFVLISHIFFSALAVPLILGTFYLSLSQKFIQHKKWARITFPVWLYVAVTGVLIFVLLNWFNV